VRVPDIAMGKVPEQVAGSGARVFVPVVVRLAQARFLDFDEPEFRGIYGKDRKLPRAAVEEPDVAVFRFPDPDPYAVLFQLDIHRLTP